MDKGSRASLHYCLGALPYLKHRYLALSQGGVEGSTIAKNSSAGQLRVASQERTFT